MVAVALPVGRSYADALFSSSPLSVPTTPNAKQTFAHKNRHNEALKIIGLCYSEYATKSQRTITNALNTRFHDMFVRGAVGPLRPHVDTGTEATWLENHEALQQ